MGEKSSSLPEEFLQLLEKRADRNFALARTNFAIGKFVCKVQEEGGDAAVKALALSCPKPGIWMENFLFETARVFKLYKSHKALYAIDKNMGHNLSWGALMKRVKPPEGESEESSIFWDSKFNQIEVALTNLEKMYETLPSDIREQLDGLLSMTPGITVAPDEEEREILTGPITFGHIADIQMSEAFTTAGRLVIDPATGKNERLLDLKRCLDFAIEAMLAKGCRVIFVPGDITETEKPTPNEQGIVRLAFEKAAETCPVIVCPGNHDLSDNPKDASSLEFLKGRRNIFVIEKPSILYLEGTTVNTEPSELWPQPDCMKVFVIPFPSKGILNGEALGKTIEELNILTSARLRLLIENFRSEIDPCVPNVLLVHLTVAGADGATNDIMLRFDPNINASDLRGFDYVGIGHLHNFQRIGGTPVLADVPEGGLLTIGDAPAELAGRLLFRLDRPLRL